MENYTNSTKLRKRPAVGGAQPAIDRRETIPDELLTQYGSSLQPTRIEAPPSSGFSGAGVFRLRCRSGDFCLRSWPAGGLSKQRILGLHRLLGFLSNQGVSTVAVPLMCGRGQTLVSAGGSLWQVEPWMPGTADYWTAPSSERLRAAMQALADWHRAAATFVPHPNESVWFSSSPAAPSPAIEERIVLIKSFVGGRCGELKVRLPNHERPELRRLGTRIVQLFERTSNAVNGQLETMRRQQFRTQPCLRDVWHDHVLFSGDAVTGLVDPSACRSENVATDLARLIGSLVGDDQASWDMAIEEYSQARPLSLDEEALVHVLDRSGVLLSGMNWLNRILMQQETVSDAERVEERLGAIIRRMESLAARL